jgi:hypothetical protein
MSDELQRYPDRLVEGFLEHGPIRMSDRLFDAIVDDIHRTRQRGTPAPWRSLSMPRFALAAAVIAVVIAVAGLTYAFTRPNQPDSGAEPSPPIATPGPAVGPRLGPPGTTLRASSFSEPFTFTMPAFPDDPPTPILGDAWDASTAAVGLPGTNKAMKLESKLWGLVTFHDDALLPADMCRPRGASIADVPASPTAVGRWLQSSEGLTVSAPVTMTVDGRPAMLWDVTLSDSCDGIASRPPPFFGPGEHHRIYAVPTGADTIIVITWGTNWSNGTEKYIDAVNAATDQLVRSMRFGG